MIFKRMLWMTILALTAGLILVACGPASATAPEEHGEHDDGHAAQAHNDHHEEAEAEENGHMEDMGHVHAEAPHEFAELTNPFSDDSEAITAGQAIFAASCVACHGPEGKGDGPAAAGLNPKPASLADGTMMHDLSDGYLYWRVSEGGINNPPFNSVMPAWKESLSEEQMWQVISYIRTLSR